MAMEEGRRGLQNVLLGAHESFHMNCPQDAHVKVRNQLAAPTSQTYLCPCQLRPSGP